MKAYILYVALALIMYLHELNGSQSSKSRLGEDQHAFFVHLQGNSTYDSRVHPYLSHGKPTDVTVNLVINGFGEFNTATMDFSVSIYLRQQWNDPRLAFRTFNVTNSSAPITLSDKVLKDMWIPDLFFSNEKQGWKHDITTPNVMVRIAPSGDILYSQRISMKLSCLYNFYRFPMDSQTCRIEMHSYAYTTKDINFIWRERDPIERKAGLYLPEFTLESETAKYCNAQTSTGEYTCIYAEFHLSRDMRYYVLNIYVPTIIVVIISFVNFWIDPRAIPARVSIGVITVLTITTQSVSLQQRLPKVSYIKAVDVWISACLIFVVASMLEYAAANVLLQREARKKEKAMRPERNVNIKKAFQSSPGITEMIPMALTEVTAEVVPLKRQTALSSDNLQLDFTPLHSKWNADNLDKVSRVVFSSAFVIFNMIYWCVYLVALG